MAGIYIHIPFCRQACNYCNFHFTTSLLYKNELIAALLKEVDIQRNYLDPDFIETIYFGGGTPSLLNISELKSILNKVYDTFTVSENAEITLEANPDDISEESLVNWKTAGINRLSVGIQSFFQEDLLWMNRAHTAEQAERSLESATRYFGNLTIDLIYGTPLLTNERWKQNVEKVLSFGIPHISCYALTIEPKTPLQKMINTGKAENVNPDKQSEQFLLLIQWLEEAGYEHYEISNFALPGRRSKHNSSYWQGKKYLGLGPSAHSFDGKSRQWNVVNNNTYINSLKKDALAFEKEILSEKQEMNEYIMTSLRTIEGLDLSFIESKFGTGNKNRLLTASHRYIDSQKMILTESCCLQLTKEGKLFADGIASDLFII
ncbi:MAG: radical SAM family heme chaperone HemW [Bacteroidetes bacterium]|nr:radical SAM family heme chaperone HemW [Bacteroidota bacterium]